MSANPFELFPSDAVAHAPLLATVSERRKRARTRVHWQVLLFHDRKAEAIASTTQDLSSSGFYCFTAVPLAAGEVLTCALKVPSHDPNGKHLDRSLECKVRVVRVEPQAADNTFGIGCQIEDYHFADATRAAAISA